MRFKDNIVLDDWQKEICQHEGDCLLLKGRRIGGTEVFAIKAAMRMVRRKTRIVMISLTEDQAQLIVMMALEYLEKNHPKMIDKSPINKPKLSSITLLNGSNLQVRPVGATGEGIRGFDGDVLGIDEAPRQPKKVWTSARPIITTNSGEIWMWGTPAAMEGYFWQQYNKAVNLKDPEARFKVWEKNSEEVLINRPISATWTQKQRDGAIRILAEEKKDMSELEYAQEYLGRFMDEISQFFNDAWLEKVLTVEKSPPARGNIYLGVDCARFGRDESTWTPVSEQSGIITQKDFTIKVKLDIVQGAKATEDEAEVWKPKKIGIDAGSGTIGVSWLDLLRRTKWRDKIVPLNNREMMIEEKGEDEVYQRMLKEDMYYLMLALGEAGRLKLINSPEVRASLASIRQETVELPSHKHIIRIFGSKGAGGDHIAEALVRAVFLAEKNKSLNLYATFSKDGKLQPNDNFD